MGWNGFGRRGLKQSTKAATTPAKKKRKATRFHGTDHWITREQLAALCAASEPLYATLWRLMAAHALRISEALSLRPCNVEGGFLTIQRLKGSQRTRQKLLVDLSAQVTFSIQCAVALNVTSQYLGHTSLASTAAYLNCSDQVASAAAAQIIGRDL
jgi:hypothetical protein